MSRCSTCNYPMPAISLAALQADGATCPVCDQHYVLVPVPATRAVIAVRGEGEIGVTVSGGVFVSGLSVVRESSEGVSVIGVL